MKNLLLTSLGLVAGLSAYSQVIVGTTPTLKNAVLEELTGKTCQYCPDGHKIADQIMTNNPGRVMVLNIHTGSYASGTPNYRTSWGDYVGSLFTVSGYPTGAVNRTNFGNGVMHSRSQWTANVANVLAQSSPVNVGANATINLDTRQVTVDVEAYYTSNGPGSSNKIHVIMTQNNIEGPQTAGATWYPAMVLPNGNYLHNKMVRYAFTPNAGDVISTVSSGSLYTNQYTYTVPTQINSIPVELADLKIAVYVSESASTGAIVTGNYANLSFQTATPLGINNGTASIDATLGAVCGTSADATIRITNMGSAALNTATIEYTVNGGAPGQYQHTFSTPLATGYYEDVVVTVPGLTPGGATSTIDLDVTMLNGSTNPNTNSSNGHTVSTAGTIGAGSTSGVINVTTDQYPDETEWELVNETTGSTVASGGPYSVANSAQPPVNVNLVDGDCYMFRITDAYGDGICCAYGNGSYSFVVGTTTIASGGSFTNEDGEKFVFDLNVGVEDIVSENGVSIYPNPTAGVSTIQLDLEAATLVTMNVYNALGALVYTNGTQNLNAGTQKLAFDGTNLPNGMYHVSLTVGDKVITKKISLLK